MSVDRSIRRIDSEIVSLVVQALGPLLRDADSAIGLGQATYEELEKLVAARARLLEELVPERSRSE